LALFVVTGIGHAFSVDADISVLAEYTGTSIDTLSNVAGLICGALFVVAEIFFAFAIDAQVIGFAIAMFLTFGDNTFAAYAKLITRAIEIGFTRWRGDTLSGFTDLFGFGAFDIGAWVFDTAVVDTGATKFTGRCGVTFIGFALSTDADLTCCTLFVVAGVFGASAIDTHLASGTGDICTGLDTFAIYSAAEAIGITGLIQTCVGCAFSIDAEGIWFTTLWSLFVASGFVTVTTDADILV
jgi:hypothetical protein